MDTPNLETFNANQRLQEIAKRLVDTNYELEDGDKTESIKTITTLLDTLTDYTDIVKRQMVMSSIWATRCEPDEYRENMQNIDRQRRNIHNATISNLNILNRICENELKIGPFVDIDTSDRQQVANFAGKYTLQVNEIAIEGDPTRLMDYAAEQEIPSSSTNNSISRKRLNALLDKFSSIEEQVQDAEIETPQ